MRFRLRTLFVLMIPLGLFLVWFCTWIDRYQVEYRQRVAYEQVTAKIESMGGYSNSHGYRIDQICFVNFCGCCSITDEDVKFLQQLSGLETLSFDYGGPCPAKITDAGLEHLKSMKHLKHVFFSEATFVTKEGVEDLREALPNTRVQASVMGEY